MEKPRPNKEVTQPPNRVQDRLRVTRQAPEISPPQNKAWCCFTHRETSPSRVVAALRSSFSDSWLGCGSVHTTKACSITGRGQAMGNSKPLSALGRCYLYALHGYLVEVLFTAAWDFATTRDWRLRGESSAWAPFIYGPCMLILERLYLHLRGRCPLPGRAVLYTACIYLWEFATGALLRHFGACPWDYSHFAYNFMGLVTLEYCGFWFVGSIVLETLVIRYILRLQLDGSGKPLRWPRAAFALKED